MGVTVTKKAIYTKMPSTPLLKAKKGVYRLICDVWKKCKNRKLTTGEAVSRYKGMSQFDSSDKLQIEWKKLITEVNKL